MCILSLGGCEAAALGGAGDAPLRLQRCAARRGANAAKQPDSQMQLGAVQRRSLNVPALDDGISAGDPERARARLRPAPLPRRLDGHPRRAAAPPPHPRRAAAAPLPPPSLLLLLLPPRRRRTLAALPVPYRALAVPRALLAPLPRPVPPHSPLAAAAPPAVPPSHPPPLLLLLPPLRD